MTGKDSRGCVAFGSRGPLALERLSRDAEGTYLYRTRRGHTLPFTAAALLERLIALLPPKGAHLTRFHATFAPNARLRPRIVKPPPSTSAEPSTPTSGPVPAAADDACPPSSPLAAPLKKSTETSDSSPHALPSTHRHAGLFFLCLTGIIGRRRNSPSVRRATIQDSTWTPEVRQWFFKAVKKRTESKTPMDFY